MKHSPGFRRKKGYSEPSLGVFRSHSVLGRFSADMKVRATYRYAKPCVVVADPACCFRSGYTGLRTGRSCSEDDMVQGHHDARPKQSFFEAPLPCQQNRSHMIVTTESIEYSWHGFSQMRNRVPASFSLIRFDPVPASHKGRDPHHSAWSSCTSCGSDTDRPGSPRRSLATFGSPRSVHLSTIYHGGLSSTPVPAACRS